MRSYSLTIVFTVYVCVCVTKAQSGSVFKTIIKNGTGPVPQRNQTVIVHYTGKLQNGEVFDSSRDRNEPFTFRLGMQEVISGWDGGISSMKVGERAEIEIPPEYAYGAEGYPPVIPASATLIFDIELLGIEGVTDQQPRAPVQLAPQPVQLAPQLVQNIGAASFATQGASSGGVPHFSNANFAPQTLPTDLQGFSSITQFPPVDSGTTEQGFSGAAASTTSFGSQSQGFSSGFATQTGRSFPQPQQEQPRTPTFTAPEPPRSQQPNGLGTVQFGTQPTFPTSMLGFGQAPAGSSMQSPRSPQSSSAGAGFRPQSFGPPPTPTPGFDNGPMTSFPDFQGSRFSQTDMFGRTPTAFPTSPMRPGFPVDRGMVTPTGPGFAVDRSMAGISGPGMGVPRQPITSGFGGFGQANDFTSTRGDFTEFRSSFEMPPFAGSSLMADGGLGDRVGMPRDAMLGFDSRRDPRFDMSTRMGPGFVPSPPRFGGAEMRVGMPGPMSPMRGGSPFFTSGRSPFGRLLRRRRAGLR